jgi:hypothetical protein
VKILLHIIAPLFLIVAGPAQAAPLAFSSPDTSSVVLIQRGFRSPPAHPVLPLGPPSSLIDLQRPDNFHLTRPAPDLAVGGGIVKTQPELYRELYGANLQRRHNCADRFTKPDKCKGRSEALR